MRISLKVYVILVIVFKKVKSCIIIDFLNILKDRIILKTKKEVRQFEEASEL